jgi:uncharacterized protein (TIGR03437 family)
VSGASFKTGVAPNSWITIFGSNLALKTDSWATAVVDGDLPTVLDGVRVTFGVQAAYIAYVSTTQINALAPNIETGNLAVVVSNSVGTSPAASTISQDGSASILHVGHICCGHSRGFYTRRKKRHFVGCGYCAGQAG